MVPYKEEYDNVRSGAAWIRWKFELMQECRKYPYRVNLLIN